MPSNKPETYSAALYEGTFSVGLDKKFNRISREDKPAKGALKISLNPFLVHTPDHKMLFDCGIGEFGEDTGPEYIRKNLDDHGLTEFDITDVFASHLHYDHIGGLANKENGYWELTFPDAKIWVSKAGWEKVMAKEVWYDDEKTEFIHFIDAKADLHFLSAEDQPYPFMSVEKIGGHTEFHQVLLFNDGQHKYMQAGDVIATRSQVNRKFAAKYDFDPETSQKQRERLARLAYEEGYIILGYHDDSTPIFSLTDFDEKTGYATNPMDPDGNS
ncbi:MBL fold metallo-hydrolase [Balneola sp. MJW-20]|uniref:MBL fold metallo-hydrolase n=1 Tax=Gracilimonas aurantiaca TaxID=3234185 RepID=UPI00346705F0